MNIQLIKYQGQLIEKGLHGLISAGLLSPVQLIKKETSDQKVLLTDKKRDNWLRNRQLIEKQTTDKKARL